MTNPEKLNHIDLTFFKSGGDPVYTLLYYIALGGYKNRKNKDNHFRDPMNNDKVGQSTNDVADGFAS